MASITKYVTSRGAVRWRVQSESSGRDGARVRQPSAAFSSYAEALAERRRREGAAATGGMGARGTLETYLREWLAHKIATGSIRGNTGAGYAGKIETAIRSIGHLPLVSVTGEDVERWLRELVEKGGLKNRPLAHSSVIQSKNILHKAMADAVRKRLIPFNPADGATAPKSRRSKPRIPEAEHVRRYLEELDKTADGAFFRVLASTGVRRSELGALMWSEVDFREGVIRVERTLTRAKRGGEWVQVFTAPKSETSRREIPILPETEALFRAQKARVAELRLAAGRGWVDHDLVFPESDGTPLRLDALSARARAAAKRAGMPAGVMPVHGLRHSFGSTLNRGGADFETMRTLMGHSRVTTTIQHYATSDADTKRKALAGLSRMLGPDPS